MKKKIAKFVIFTALVFGSNKLYREKIRFKRIFYHLVCNIHLVNKDLDYEVTKPTLKELRFWEFLQDAFVA